MINRDGQYCGCNEFREEMQAQVAEPAAGRLVWVQGQGGMLIPRKACLVGDSLGLVDDERLQFLN